MGSDRKIGKNLAYPTQMQPVGPDPERWEAVIRDEDSDVDKPNNGGEMAVEVDPVDTTDIETEPKSSLNAKILHLMAKVGSMPKDGTNAFHNYKYMSDAALKAKLQPALVELGLIALQRMHVITNEWVENSKGERSNYVLVSCSLSVIDVEGGDEEQVTSLGSGMDKGDKAVMKAQTAAHKYAWSHMLNIPTGDDPEADATTDVHMSTSVSEPRELPIGEVGSVKARVVSVKKRSENPKSPWVITTPVGSYTTFNKDIATEAELAMGLGAEIAFEYKTEVFRGNAEHKIVDPPKKKETN